MNQIDPHICQICNKYYDKIGAHVRKIHKLEHKEYYDKYLKSENEGICPVCGKETSFRRITAGYRHHCSVSCSSADPNVQVKNRATTMERYGVEHNWNKGKLREKQEETMMKKYGVKHNWQSSDLRSKEKLKVSPDEQFFMDELDKLGISYKYRYYGGSKYPYECDFYLDKLDTYVELNISPFHDNHFFDKNNDEDVKLLNTIKQQSKTSSWYASKLRIWLKDSEKHDTAKRNNLNYVVLWSRLEIELYIDSLQVKIL